MKIRVYRSLLALLVLLAVVSSAAPPSLAQAPIVHANDYAAELAAIEQRLEERRKHYGIPGVALAIVKDDKVVYLKGLGVKDYEKRVPVTPETQFAIGSATKAFTGLSVLMSQDEGKLSLDDAPRRHLPYFKMYDPETDKNIRVRDLLSHSSGLTRTDLAMVTGKLSRAELIQVAARAKPAAKLREKFQYQNIMFTAAGEIVSRVQRQPWESFVKKRILAPLGMTNSTLTMREMQKAKDYSFGYTYNFDTKETTRQPFREIEQVAPAGSINSSARDMAQWLRFVLGRGSIDGKRLVSESAYEEWVKPQMAISEKRGYGLGWFTQEWRGLKVIQHGGNIDGFNSMVAMVPENKLGFVLLTNVSGSPLGDEMMTSIFENFLGEKTSESSGKLALKMMERMAGKYHLAEAKTDLEVKIVGEDMFLSVPGQPDYKLERFAPREFKLVGAPDGFAVKFTPERGDAAEMFLQQPHGNFTLKRVIPASADVPSDAGFAAARELVGTYKGPKGGTVDVRESDGRTKLLIGAQQPYTLAETSKGVFSMSPLPASYFLTVGRGSDGKITHFEITQPEGTFKFEKVPADTRPLPSVDELFARAIEAAGGEANMRKITSRVIEMTMDLENQGVQGKATIWSKAPDRSATASLFTALGKTIGTGYEFYDGTRGETAYSFAPVEKWAGLRLDDGRIASDLYALLNYKAPYKKVEVTKIAKVGDEEAFAVRFEPIKGTEFTDYYSTKTFLLLKREGVVPSSTMDLKIPYSTTFSDYRGIDGVMLPFKMVSSNVAQGSVVMTVTGVKQNVEIDDKVFGPGSQFRR